jgi:hypothetical protein
MLLWLSYRSLIYCPLELPFWFNQDLLPQISSPGPFIARQMVMLLLSLFMVYLTVLFQYLRLYSMIVMFLSLCILTSTHCQALQSLTFLLWLLGVLHTLSISEENLMGWVFCLENCWMDLDEIWYGHYAIGISYSLKYKHGRRTDFWDSLSCGRSFLH